MNKLKLDIYYYIISKSEGRINSNSNSNPKFDTLQIEILKY